jgi:hypothetical protein
MLLGALWGEPIAQCATCPPKTALRQYSIALIIFNRACERRPRMALRAVPKACGARRRTEVAENVRDFQR